MISNTEALELLKENLKNENLVKHCLAAEVIMKDLAVRFGEDEDVWGITGLLHDIDYEKTEGQPQNHGILAEDILKDYDVSDEIIRAIKAHNYECTGIKPESLLDKALRPAETITGLIVATSLVYPDKKIKSVKPKSIKKRMKEKAFARSVNREVIRECELIDIELQDFIILSLEAMKKIDHELGL